MVGGHSRGLHATSIDGSQTIGKFTYVQTVAQPSHNTRYDHLRIAVGSRLEDCTNDHDDTASDDGSPPTEVVAYPEVCQRADEASDFLP